jgi:signal transduction histidine kinase
MKANTDARLTLSYLRKLERENYLALTAVILLSAAGLFGLLFHIGGKNNPDLVSNIMYPLTSFIGAGHTTIVGVLVAIRSWLATRENDRLLDALAKAYSKQEAIAIERTQLYEGLRAAHERLQELDKLKDQFMITASHELRTPLTAVQGYLELLVQYGNAVPMEQQREFLLKAQHACEELVLLLNNVMDASRLEIDAGIRPAHLQCVQVREEVQSVIALIEPQLAHEQRKVEVSIPDSLAVRADPVRFRQVLLNLSVNALKYSPPRHLLRSRLGSLRILFRVSS